MVGHFFPLILRFLSILGSNLFITSFFDDLISIVCDKATTPRVVASGQSAPSLDDNLPLVLVIELLLEVNDADLLRRLLWIGLDALPLFIRVGSMDGLVVSLATPV